MSYAKKINETNKSSDGSLITLKELCEDLSVSVATGRNWIRLGKIEPQLVKDGTAYFTIGYANRLKSDISSGRVSALKSRRNKKYISGNNLYNYYVSPDCKGKETVQSLLTMLSDENIELTEDIIRILEADCAVKLFYDVRSKSKEIRNGNLLKSFLTKEISFGGADELINDLIDNNKAALSFCNKYPNIFELEYSYEKNEDVLGLIFISCSNMGKRKHRGAYFTPNGIVKKLIEKALDDIDDNKTILDPCCGTGNFLLQLPDSTVFENIYGNDIDPISVRIARINMALKYGIDDPQILKEHITCGNFLEDGYDGEECCAEHIVVQKSPCEPNKYDLILGNPPWGYDFSAAEKENLRKQFVCAKGSNIESYDVFIESGIKHLDANGILSFVLPEAVLNVRAHSGIRQFLLDSSSLTYLEYLGDAFDGVQCPSIILSAQKTGATFTTKGLTVKDTRREYVIETDRAVSKDAFSFLATDEEYELLEKLLHASDVCFLKDNADFALGIVTGNNAKYISNVKRKNNEIVLKGSDISKFFYRAPGNYIEFKPKSFQQVAPTELYRAKEKLFYKFISSGLVFAYDDRQTLSLNSCNIVIPRIEGLPIKYILAVLNSSVAEFVFEKMFNSVKVLRSHIEGIPIPVADVELMDRIIQFTDKLISSGGEKGYEEAYLELNELIFEAYGLDEREKKTVRSVVSL